MGTKNCIKDSPLYFYIYFIIIKEMDTSCSSSLNNIATLTIENATNQH